MTFVARTLLALTVFVAGLTACSDSNRETVTGKGSLRGIHAIPELASVNFMIEETELASLSYKDASGISEYDDLNYDFNFDIRLPGETDDTRLVTENLTVNAETEYTFVLAGTLAEPEIILWQQPGRDWQKELDLAKENDTELTVLENSFGHLDPGLGPVDVFLETPGTSPQSATPKGTIGYGELLPAIEFSAGEYQLVLTPEGDAATILFASDPVTLNAATSNLLAIMDDGGLTTAEFSVRLIGTSLGVELLDLNVQPEISAVHAAFGTDPVDLIIGDSFARPFVSGLAYSNIATPGPIGDGKVNVNVIPAGNPGVFLAEKEINIQKGTYNRLYLVGLPGLAQIVVLSDDRRRLATHTRVQLFQGAARFQTMDIYLVDVDTDIALIGPTHSKILFGSGTYYADKEAGDYNVVLTEPGTKNIVGGPFQLNMALGRNYDIVVVDAPDITAADILVFDKTPE